MTYARRAAAVRRPGPGPKPLRALRAGQCLMGGQHVNPEYARECPLRRRPRGLGQVAAAAKTAT